MISREALLKLFESLRDEHETNAISYNALYEVILRQPTIEAMPVVHGEWIAQDEGLTKFKCSRCASPNYGGHEQFCPACGADMRKKV